MGDGMEILVKVSKEEMSEMGMECISDLRSCIVFDLIASKPEYPEFNVTVALEG